MNKKTCTIETINTLLLLGLLLLSSAARTAEDGAQPKFSEGAKLVPHQPSIFGPDPSYEKKPYDPKAQLEIYGGKQAYEVHRPLLELGHPMYSTGLLNESSYVFGKKNPSSQQFLAYGDIRAVASNVQRADDTDISQVALQLNLDLDWKLTATERFHVLLRPLEEDGRLTRWESVEDPVTGEREENTETESDFEPIAAFFEGDLGAMVAGFGGEYTRWDLPFAVGLMPLLFQNGVWLDDAFTGLAFSIPALHSTSLDISNMDISFFFGFDKVSSGLDSVGDSDVNVYGVTTFIEANEGYWELGYAMLDDQSELGDQSYHNASIAFSKRYGGLISNSIRLIGNFGQSRDNNADKTADGYAVLIENSLITSKPTTLVPYLNLFYGVDRPQSVARDPNNGGGILKNTGITFDGGLAKIPTMDATAFDTAGFALGVEYLFALNQQLVVEASMLSDQGDDSTLNVAGDQIGIGVRYQLPLTKAWIFRADANVIKTQDVPPGVEDQLVGVALEIRRKF
ncbi:MAG TPA: hypothetical protein VIM41_11350 [Gammaproteobacteria bacterium]